MGKAQPERVNQVFSIVTIACFVVSALSALIVYIAAPWLGLFLGTKTGSQTIVGMISKYLKGFSFGMIQMRLNIMLSSIMMLDNDKNRSIFPFLWRRWSIILFLMDFRMGKKGALI